MPQLFVLSGADVGRSFELKNGSTLGRNPDCDVVLKDRSVSRRHAHVERKGPGWCIIDDGSRNGLRIDELRVARADLKDGLEIVVGELLMRFRVGSTASEAPVAGEMSRAGAAAVENGEEEILLEGLEDEVEPAAPSAPVAGSAGPVPAPLGQTTFTQLPPPLAPERAVPIDTGFGRAPARAGEQLSRARQGAGDRVLQYHKVAQERGVLAADLAQYPAWVRLLAYTLALALAAALFYAAFFGTSFLKEKVQGAPESELDSEE